MKYDKNKITEKNIISQQELELLIDRYFDAETTESEESFLRKNLAISTCNSPKVLEAKAVLGLFAAQKTFNKKTLVRSRVTLKIAATIALLIASGGLISYFSIGYQRNECVAYIAGEKVNDADKIMNLINKDLEEVRLASDETKEGVKDQLEVMFEIMNSNSETIN